MKQPFRERASTAEPFLVSVAAREVRPNLQNCACVAVTNLCSALVPRSSLSKDSFDAPESSLRV